MIDTLLSVPPRCQEFFASPTGQRLLNPRLAEASGRAVFVGTDPAGSRLGSGGGTVNLLYSAWSKSFGSHNLPFDKWLRYSQKLIIHAGGESRRLPAYAALGKTFLPIPSLDELTPRRFDQMLIDMQAPAYQQVLHEAGPNAVVMVASGDVWLDFDPLLIPEMRTDIAGIGMSVAPEIAQNFGVFFVRKNSNNGSVAENKIAMFRQKPSPAEIYRQLAHHDAFVDTGMWLLSAEAVRLLFRRCGWDESRQRFSTSDGRPEHLDLYTEIGCALGESDAVPSRLKKAGWGRLTTSVIPLRKAHFHHLGSTEQLFESLGQMQKGRLVPERSFAVATSLTKPPRTTKGPIWLDDVHTPDGVTFEGHNVLTGLPSAATVKHLKADWCVEVAPVGDRDYVFRPYHISDNFRGAATKGGRICGIPAERWLATRGFKIESHDVFELALYPVLRASEISQAALEWFFSNEPDAAITERMRRSPRLSAKQICDSVDFERLFSQRYRGYARALQSEFLACVQSGNERVCAQDFGALAQFCNTSAPELRIWILKNRESILAQIGSPVYQARFLSLVGELTRGTKRAHFQKEASERLRNALVSSNQLARARPQLALKEDQIVWSRSPARLDLAGGWTDTPPYCLEWGGAVLNVAVLLNGQPPIQVFVRPLREPRFRLRSIDLGSAEEITTYKGLSQFRDPKSNFSLAKAALALSGFHPDFCAGKRYRTLREQLRAFGGGFELSLLSAVPKGSGLGTSSILAATLLGALNRACALKWQDVDLYNRVLGIEQLLTTGGGWQDQAGALFRSIKLVQTTPGLAQAPSVRYVPDQQIAGDAANTTLLLYYTGITRLAKGILKEITHDMLNGRGSTLTALGFIRSNALHLYQALQEGSEEALRRCVARSWDLNKRLDPGTSTREIDRLIASCGDDLAACKLLGAGGGGYMLICARSPDAGRRIRAKLELRPPNPRARFIDFKVADRGLTVTVS
jgi:galactokinase/mevalonate kinase-like predicted kinase